MSWRRRILRHVTSGLARRRRRRNLAARLKLNDSVPYDVPLIQLHTSASVSPTDQTFRSGKRESRMSPLLLQFQRCAESVKTDLERCRANLDEAAVNHFQLLSVGHLHNLAHCQLGPPVSATMIASD